jgi:demethylmenaquinone methyltransferase / 2-methoxy-6-polyprenyl-1,4-benzoquinol methylase
MPDGPTIQRMFADVAPRYDRANRVLSLGVDQYWRRQAVRLARVRQGDRALDVCAGTLDLTLALVRAGARTTATDFCQPMLGRGIAKIARLPPPQRPPLACADTLALPFRDASFDLCTVAFGIRNVADPRAGLAEMKRVVAPGGRVVVLEFCRPRTPLFAGVWLFYFRRVLPRLGKWISRTDNDAYGYLPESVMRFPEREGFLDLMRQAGLASPRAHILTGGIAAIYRGEVAA